MPSANAEVHDGSADSVRLVGKSSICENVTAVEQPCPVQELEVGHRPGINRLCLRLPTVVTHAIGPDSPLAHWDEPSGILQDADSEIVVVVSTPCRPPGLQQEPLLLMTCLRWRCITDPKLCCIC